MYLPQNNKKQVRLRWVRLETDIFVLYNTFRMWWRKYIWNRNPIYSIYDKRKWNKKIISQWPSGQAWKRPRKNKAITVKYRRWKMYERLDYKSTQKCCATESIEDKFKEVAASGWVWKTSIELTCRKRQYYSSQEKNKNDEHLLQTANNNTVSKRHLSSDAIENRSENSNNPASNITKSCYLHCLSF